MTKYFFTADWHLGHRRILKLSNRPFNNIEDHDSTILNSINSVVDKNDYLYVLGDLGYNKDFNKIKSTMNNINGRKIIIIGNHDNLSFYIQLKRMGMIEDVRESKTLNIGRDRVFLSHYPFLEWPGFFHGALHAHGHTHNNLPRYRNMCDVGVDAWDYKPVELEDLVKYIRSYKG